MTQVILIEDALNTAKKSVITIAGLKKILPKQVNHNTLKTILEHLEESNKIAVGNKGITWIHNSSPILRKTIARGFEL